ncbi:MAG: multidrug effflux MFS transporter [Propionibacterium sp.]|nr:multidrug effflux MFS transporter [Propionibacterium sp.]
MAKQLGDRYSRRRKIAIIVTLGLLTGLGPFTIDLYLPAFPAIKLDLGLTDPQVQLTLSATVIGFAVGQLLVGPVSDRVGRKLPLMAMTTLHVAASVLVALASNLEFLAAMRSLQGIGAAGGSVVAMAMARDLFSGSRLMRMLARLALINGLAPIVAPIFGSWMVAVMDWRGIFWALALYGATIIALSAAFLVETRPAGERSSGGIGSILVSYRVVLGDRQYVGALLAGAFAFAGLFSYVSTSSVLLQEGYGLGVQAYGAVFAVCSFGVLIGVQLGSRLHRLSSSSILRAGAGVMVASGVALVTVSLLSGSLWLLVPLMFVYTTGFGACMPNAQVLALTNHRENSGVAASLMGASNMGLAAVVGPVIGTFDTTSAMPMAVGMLILAALASASTLLVIRR